MLRHASNSHLGEMYIGLRLATLEDDGTQSLVETHLVST